MYMGVDLAAGTPVKRVLFSRLSQDPSRTDSIGRPLPLPARRTHAPRPAPRDLAARGRPGVRGPAVPEVHSRAGAVGAAALGVAVDVIGGSLSLRAVQPDWAVTSTLALHLLRPIARDFEVTGAPLRAGATQVVLDVEVS